MTTKRRLNESQYLSRQQNPKFKIKEKWKHLISNRTGILDTGCSSGAGAEKDIDLFIDTGFPLEKILMLPDKTTIKATWQMQLRHNLQPEASKMNIVPNLHSTLISVPKMAGGEYIAVFEKSEARIYDGTTTTITASNGPLLVAPRCTGTGLWKLSLDYEVLGHEYPPQTVHCGSGCGQCHFDLPDNCQTLTYYHAAAGFPTKETFLSAVRAGNFATWPGLTTTLVSKYFPDLEET
jgi:hypothetical protein